MKIKMQRNRKKSSKINSKRKRSRDKNSERKRNTGEQNVSLTDIKTESPNIATINEYGVEERKVMLHWTQR